MASAEFENPEQQYIHERDERTESMCARVYDNILSAQQRNKQQQLQLLAGRKPGRGRKLHAGDLAYVVTPKPNKKNAVAGPFVVETIVGNTVHLRTTRNVPG